MDIQLLVRVLDRETPVALAVKGEHPLHLVHGHPLGRGRARAAVVQTIQTLVFVADHANAETSVRLMVPFQMSTPD